MSLRWVESFDSINTVAQLNRKYNTVVVVTFGPGRNGNCAKMSAGSAMLNLMFPATKQKWISGFAVNFQPYGGVTTIWGLRDWAAGYQVYITFNTGDNTIAFWRYPGVILGWYGPLTVNQWYHMQVKVFIHNTLGSFEVRLNNVSVISGTNVDTQSTGTAGANIHEFGGNAWIDDWWICDGDGAAYNDFLGDLKAIQVKPNGVGNYSEWTPSAGANWQCVDEAPPTDDTDYVASSTVGQRDTYAMENPGFVGAIKGVQHNVMVRKDDAGVRTARTLYRGGGVDFDGVDVTLNTTYQVITRVMETDPATGVDWTTLGINAAEFGEKITA